MVKKAVVSFLCTLTGVVIGAGVTRNVSKDKLNNIQFYSDKHLALFLMMNQWVKVKQKGKSLTTFFKKNGYKKIAIYGMSYAGETLVDEFKGSDIKIEYAIDRDAKFRYSDVDTVSLEDEFKEVDAIVVTAITFFDEIKEELSGRIDCPILSLEDVLYEI